MGESASTDQGGGIMMLLGTGSGSGISRFIHIALLVTGVHSKLQEVLKSEQDTEALAKRFADRTSYTYMQNNDTSPVVLEGCSPVLLYVVARHGARIPSDDLLVQMQVDLLVIRDRLVAAWLEGGGELNEQEV